MKLVFFGTQSNIAWKLPHNLKRLFLKHTKRLLSIILQREWLFAGERLIRDNRFAIIIDEAHSSQTGSAYDNINHAIGKDAEQDVEKS